MSDDKNKPVNKKSESRMWRLVGLIIPTIVLLVIIAAYTVYIQPVVTLVSNRTSLINNVQQNILNTSTNTTVIYDIQIQSFSNYSSTLQNLLIMAAALLGLYGLIYIDILKDRQLDVSIRGSLLIFGSLPLILLIIDLFGIIYGLNLGSLYATLPIVQKYLFNATCNCTQLLPEFNLVRNTSNNLLNNLLILTEASIMAIVAVIVIFGSYKIYDSTYKSKIIDTDE